MKQSNRNGANSRVTVYERVTQKITELLKQGVVPWQKPWNAHVGPPRNGVSGRYYRGLNVFMLSHAGFDSPWWFSPKQVNDLDGHIRKGEKVSWVHFFKPGFPRATPTRLRRSTPTRRRFPSAARCSSSGPTESSMWTRRRSRDRQIPGEAPGGRARETRQRSHRSLRPDR